MDEMNRWMDANKQIDNEASAINNNAAKISSMTAIDWHHLHFAHLTNCAVVHSKLPGDSKCPLIRRVLQDVVGGEAPDQIALDRSREGHGPVDAAGKNDCSTFAGRR